MHVRCGEGTGLPIIITSVKMSFQEKQYDMWKGSWAYTRSHHFLSFVAMWHGKSTPVRSGDPALASLSSGGHVHSDETLKPFFMGSSRVWGETMILYQPHYDKTKCLSKNFCGDFFSFAIRWLVCRLFITWGEWRWPYWLAWTSPWPGQDSMQ